MAQEPHRGSPTRREGTYTLQRLGGLGQPWAPPRFQQGGLVGSGRVGHRVDFLREYLNLAQVQLFV